MATEDMKEVTITRTFDAPRDLVWKAWTDPKLIAEWWGPNGVTIPVCEFEAVPNGKVHIVMEAGEAMGPIKGTQWPMVGMLQEIIEPSRLVFTSVNMKDETGKSTFETLNTITFEEADGKTTVNVHIEVVVLVDSPMAKQAFGGMSAGWNQQMDKMVAFVQRM